MGASDSHIAARCLDRSAALWATDGRIPILEHPGRIVFPDPGMENVQPQNLDIWVQGVGGGDPIQRTSEPADETEPSFSPDGSQIAFSRRDAGIHVMGTLSGKPRLVAPLWGRTPRFSPDGKWIAFWTGFPPSVVAGGIPEAVGSMYVVPCCGGEPRLIHTPLASERYPIWSPDGEYLLFLGEENPDLKTHD